MVDVGAPEKERAIDVSAVYGFRADGETLVVQRQSEPELLDWSTKTQSGRPSDFATAARGAEAICLSPDDVHLVTFDSNGAAMWRSTRSGEAPVPLSAPPGFGDELPKDCVFAPSGKAFAIATDDRIAIYRAGKSEPEQRLSIGAARALAWSNDERVVTFSVPDQIFYDGRNLFYLWEPARDHADLLDLGGPGAVDTARRQIHVRTRCAWSRLAFDGRRLGADKRVADEDCFHVRAHEVALAPNGAFLAAAEGAWGGYQLVVTPLR